MNGVLFAQIPTDSEAARFELELHYLITAIGLEPVLNLQALPWPPKKHSVETVSVPMPRRIKRIGAMTVRESPFLGV